MATPRQPQDRKPKAGKFSFTHKGREYVFPKPLEEVTRPGWLRANRRRDDLDMTFTLIEVLADGQEDILAAVDAMELSEFNRLSTRLGKVLNDSFGESEELGESGAS